MEQPQPLPQILSPCTRGCGANSPEFEFWMVGNPSFPQPNLLSADQLFSDGFLLPLQLLQLSTDPPPPPQDAETTVPDKPPEPQPSPLEPPPELSANSYTKRWRHIFKKKLASSIPDDHSNKEKREKKKNGGAVGFGAGNVVSAAELNINIWPFSRSRSARNGGTRPRAVSATRKVSSAPCSRSNSTGDSKSRKWPPHSPNRPAGVHLGRNSPVWQVRRSGGGGGGRSAEAFIKNGGRRDGRKFPASKATVLSLNVPVCIGYPSSCRHDESSTVSAAAAAAHVGGDVVRRSNLFNIRSLFTKKVD